MSRQERQLMFFGLGALGLCLVMGTVATIGLFAQRPNHADVIAQAQVDLKAAGISLDGDCGAFRVVNLAAWRLKQAGEADAGVLAKTGGSGCSQYGGLYAKDVVAYQSGQHYDTIVASGAMGGNGAAAWNDDGIRSDITCPCPPGLWRAPIDPVLYGFGGVVAGPPVVSPPSTSPAPSVDLGPILARLDALEKQTQAQAQTISGLTDWQVRVETHFGAVEGRIAPLEARPLPTTCSAYVNFGFAKVPIAGCALK